MFLRFIAYHLNATKMTKSEIGELLNKKNLFIAL